MHPVLFNIGIPIHTYGVLVAIAFLLGMKVTLDRTTRTGLDKERIINLSLLILISSIVGARLLYVLENWRYFKIRPLEILLVNRGGLSYFGGLTTALLASIAYARRKGLKIFLTADVFMPGLALGQSIGRLGCYFNGCCYGKLMIPAQLISSAADLALFCALTAIDNRKKRPGVTLFSYLMGYGLIRFFLEFLRADNPVLSLGWTLPQALALASLFVGFVGLLRLPDKSGSYYGNK